MADLAEAVIAHVSRGRVRLKVPEKKHDADFFRALEGQLAGFPGVEKVEANPVTGSVLVLHRLNLRSSEDVDVLAASSSFSSLLKLVFRNANEPAQPHRGSVSLARNWAMSLATLNEQITASTGGVVDMPTLAIAGLVAISLRQMRQGVIFIPAMTALWYASSLLRDQLQDGHRSSSS